MTNAGVGALFGRARSRDQRDLERDLGEGSQVLWRVPEGIQGSPYIPGERVVLVMRAIGDGALSPVEPWRGCTFGPETLDRREIYVLRWPFQGDVPKPISCMSAEELRQAWRDLCGEGGNRLMGVDGELRENWGAYCWGTPIAHIAQIMDKAYPGGLEALDRDSDTGMVAEGTSPLQDGPVEGDARSMEAVEFVQEEAL